MHINAHASAYDIPLLVSRSVKQITLPESFDKEGNPILHGLADPALGPQEQLHRYGS